NSELRTQNSELRTQNSELRTQNPELRTSPFVRTGRTIFLQNNRIKLLLLSLIQQVAHPASRLLTKHVVPMPSLRTNVSVFGPRLFQNRSYARGLLRAEDELTTKRFEISIRIPQTCRLLDRRPRAQNPAERKTTHATKRKYNRKRTPRL